MGFDLQLIIQKNHINYNTVPIKANEKTLIELNDVGEYLIFTNSPLICPKKIIVDSPELKCIKITDLNYDKIDNEFEVEFTMYDILGEIKKDSLFNNKNYRMDVTNNLINATEFSYFKDGVSRSKYKIKQLFSDNIIFNLYDNKLKIHLYDYNVEKEFIFNELSEGYPQISSTQYAITGKPVKINTIFGNNINYGEIEVIYRHQFIEKKIIQIKNIDYFYLDSFDKSGLLEIEIKWRNSKSNKININLIDENRLDDLIEGYKNKSSILQSREESVNMNNEKLVCELFSKLRKLMNNTQE